MSSLAPDDLSELQEESVDEGGKNKGDEVPDLEDVPLAVWKAKAIEARRAKQGLGHIDTASRSHTHTHGERERERERESERASEREGERDE